MFTFLASTKSRRMWVYVAAVLCLFIAAPCAGTKNSRHTRQRCFCRGLDCPDYTVQKKYEVRCYPSYKWASTVVTGLEYKKASRTGFMRLFRYIQGANAARKNISMTAPVAIQVQGVRGQLLKSITVNFFVPFAHQANPIPPTNPEVVIRTLPPMCVYVKSFPGFGSNPNDILKQSAELTRALAQDGLDNTYRTDSMFYCGYDSPFRLVDRHNEIWFIRRED